MAEQINRTVVHGMADALIISAPPHTMHAIRDKLNADVPARIVGSLELEKDLVKVPLHELQLHRCTCEHG